MSETWSPESKPEYIGADAIRAPYQKMLTLLLLYARFGIGRSHCWIALHLSMQARPYLRPRGASRTWSVNLPVGAGPGGLGC